MNNLEKFFEEIYQLSHLREEEATRLVIDVIHFYRNHETITEDEEWNWITNRVTNELQRGDVKSAGYLQGLTWSEFFKNVNSELKNIEPEIKGFIKELFIKYKRALWGLEAIKDEDLKPLKVADSKHDRAYQNTPVKGTEGIKNSNIEQTLSQWLQSKQP